MQKPFVIDADGHVIEPLGMWKEHTESRYHARLPRPVTDENGLFCYVVDDVYLMRTASRLSTQRRTGVIVSRCMNRASSPSSLGQSKRCQCVDITQ